MKATNETTVRITLELTEHEAKWLKALVQNKLASFETPEDAHKRESLFNALTDAGVKI